MNMGGGGENIVFIFGILYWPSQESKSDKLKYYLGLFFNIRQIFNSIDKDIKMLRKKLTQV